MLAILLIFLVAVPTTNATWPAFLGGAARSDVSEASALPLDWSPKAGIDWQVEVAGHGQSSPVIWQDRVFLTSVEGPNKDVFRTLCLDLASGAELWQSEVQNSFPVENSLYVSRAAPTPVVDSERLIVLFESGDCLAYSHEGESLWQRSLGADYGPLVNEFGLGASPCQTEGLVFVLLEHNGPSYLLALSKASGETVWKSERDSKQSWSSPAIVSVAGSPQVVVSSGGTVDGYDPSSGTQLWSYGDVGGNTGATPIDCGQGRILVGASAGRRGENADMAKKSNCLIQVSQRDQDDGWQVKKLWFAEDASLSWASPILHQGLAYWVNRVGVVYCIDALSGEPVYTQRTKQSCWATPVGVGDRIYFFGKDGVTTVLAAGRQFEVLAENSFWQTGDPPSDASLNTEESSAERRQAAAMFKNPTVYGVAIASGRIVARIGNRVYCVGE